MQGKELEQKRFDSDFLAELHGAGRYESMTTMEKTDFEGRPCYKVRLVRRDGGEEFEFYDVETGLKAGGITTRESPMGPITGTMIETDYKKFGTLRRPTTLKQTAMGLQQVITLTSIEYDKVDPATFDAAGGNQGAHEVKRGAIVACVALVTRRGALGRRTGPAPVDTFDAVWKIVRDTHFDPRMNGVDWNAVRTELRPRALAATSPASCAV